jgi:hypothetical protein
MTTLSQLSEVADALDASGLEWWLTSGSLLGLVREGQLLEWDNDIDVECWLDSRRLSEARRRLRLLGYRVSALRWHGTTYKLWATHPQRPRSVDVHVMQSSESLAWSPVKVWHPRGPKFARSVGRLVRFIWRRTSLLDRYLPNRFGFRVYSIQLPIRLIDSVARYEVAQESVPVPRSPERLLAWRYGRDWRTPSREWRFGRDDPSYVRAPPPASRPYSPES